MVRVLKYIALSLLAFVGIVVAAALVWIWTKYEPFPEAVPVDIAQVADSVLSPAYRDQLTEALLEYREEYGLPSVSAAIGLDGDVVYAAAVGYTDLKERRQATVDSRYRIGSISKSITAAAMGALRDEDKIDLDARFRQYVPGFPEKRWPFTLRQLASHTAGIRDYREGFFAMLNEQFHHAHYDTVSEALALVQDDPLVFKPGTDYRYSSYGFNILSAGLEAANRSSFAELLDEKVFVPAGMTTARVEDVRDVDPDGAGYYIQLGRRSLRAPYTDNSYKVASGGLVASPSDLVRFGNRLLDGTLVGESTRKQLFALVYREEGTDDEGYGLGFEVETLDVQGTRVRVVGHGGGSIGGRTSFWTYPDYGLVVVVTANVNPYIEVGAGGRSWRRPKRIGERFAREIIAELKEDAAQSQAVEVNIRPQRIRPGVSVARK